MVGNTTGADGNNHRGVSSEAVERLGGPPHDEGPANANSQKSQRVAVFSDRRGCRRLDLRNRLSDWMHDRGISQWHRSDVSEDRIRHQAEAGQWWVIRSDTGDLIAAVRTLDEDPQIWGPADWRAVYVHGLMVDRRHAGHGVGCGLLIWAAEYGRRQAAEVVRLDCVATNRDLCNYYLDQGFTRVGTKQLPPQWGSAAVFERSI